jgi:hypothetical protein
MSLNFFKLLVQLSFTKNQFVHFAPQPFRPTLPILKQRELRQRVSQEFYCINNIMISEGIMDKMDK